MFDLFEKSWGIATSESISRGALRRSSFRAASITSSCLRQATSCSSRDAVSTSCSYSVVISEEHYNYNNVNNKVKLKMGTDLRRPSSRWPLAHTVREAPGQRRRARCGGTRWRGGRRPVASCRDRAARADPRAPRHSVAVP